MNKAKILMVAEGKTDQLVINELAQAYFKQHPEMGISVELVAEQPSVDKTSGGGWSAVYKWCLSNPPQERINEYFGAGLFGGELSRPQCDGLLVHIDADVCGCIATVSTVSPVPGQDATPAMRGEFIRKTVEEWLWPDGAEKDDRHIVAPAVEAIECWLVAGLSAEDLDPESNHDIQKRLAELDHSAVRKVPIPANLKKPKKTLDNYGRIVQAAKAEPDRIYEVCQHFRIMIKGIVNISSA